MILLVFGKGISMMLQPVIIRVFFCVFEFLQLTTNFFHFSVKFLLVIFQPFMGEVLEGEIMRCTDDGIRSLPLVISVNWLFIG